MLPEGLSISYAANIALPNVIQFEWIGVVIDRKYKFGTSGVNIVTQSSEYKISIAEALWGMFRRVTRSLVKSQP